MSKSKSKKMCPKCTEVQLTRVARHGFLQEHVYPKFGLFPWECAQCREVFLLKSRGVSYRKARPVIDRTREFRISERENPES